MEATSLPNAPLAYFIGMARFPKFPLSEKHVSDFHQKLRASFPHLDDTTMHGQQIEISPAGAVHIETRQDRVWQLTDLERKSAFLLGDEFLAWHTIDYKGHVSFADNYVKGLEALMQIPDAGPQVVDSVGVRYVDVIAPRDGEGIEAYLQPSVLPTRLLGQDLSGPRATSSLSVGTYASEFGALRYQVMHNPPFTIPMDLNTPLLETNAWRPLRPNGDFALVDIDHGMRFDLSRTISLDEIRNSFISLRDCANQVLRALATDYAFDVWNNRA